MARRRKVVIFLGAGASIPLGYPGTTDVVEEFRLDLSKRPRQNRREIRRLGKIRRVLEANGLQLDSESLYSCLQGLTNPSTHLVEAGPFSVLMTKTQPIASIHTDDVIKSLKSKFERFMLSKYYLLTPAMKVRIIEVYNRLLSRLAGSRNWRNQGPNWDNTVFEIFTTNYDLSMETYANLAGLDLVRGIRADLNGYVIFTPEEYKSPSPQIKLYKLHGSIDYSALRNGRIKLDISHYPGEGSGDEEVLRKIMVYGITKDLTAEPYFDLLSMMKNSLKKSKRWFVVGYSFRDQWIRNIFSDVIRSDRESKEIVYIDPTPELKMAAYPFLQGITRPIPNHLEEFLELPAAK